MAEEQKGLQEKLHSINDCVTYCKQKSYADAESYHSCYGGLLICIYVFRFGGGCISKYITSLGMRKS